MSTVAPRSILNPAGPLVRRRRVDRLSAPQLAALRQAIEGMQSDGAYAELANLYAGRAGGGTWWFLGWNRAYLRMFEAAMLERVARRRAAVVGLDAAARGAAPRSRRRTARSRSSTSRPRVASRARGVTKASPAALPTQADLRGALALEDFHAFSGRIEELHNIVHAWAGGRSTRSRPPPSTRCSGRSRRRSIAPGGCGSSATRSPGRPRRSRRCCSTRSACASARCSTRRRWATTTRRTRGARCCPGYISDTVGADPVDHLGIEPEVEALCWVIAARDTVPPLSVGLFGDWGSGKTTFMALMQARIRDLAEQSRTAPGEPVVRRTSCRSPSTRGRTPTTTCGRAW